MKVNNQLLTQSIKDVLQETTNSGIPACLFCDLDSITDPFLDDTETVQDFFRVRVICQYVVDSVLSFLDENLYADSDDAFENISDEGNPSNKYIWPLVAKIIRNILDTEEFYKDFCVIIDKSFGKYLEICQLSGAIHSEYLRDKETYTKSE